MHTISKTISAIVGAVLLVAVSLAFGSQPVVHAAGGTISGVVRTAQGVPIPNATVRAIRDEPGWVAPPVTVTADANGAFSLMGLASAEYRIGAAATGYAARYANAGSWAQATKFAVTADSTFTSDITLYQPTATVAGRILDDHGDPVVGATVNVGVSMWPMGLYPFTTLDHFGRAVLTGADGRYTVAGLAPGDFFMTVTPPDATLIGGRYPTLTGPPSAFAVGPGATVTGIDLALPHSATVTGRITSPSGAPIAGAYVTTEGWDVITQTNTAADGTYTLTGVPPGSHPVWAQTVVGPYLTSYSGNTPYGPDATLINAVAGGTTSGVDITMIQGVEVLVHVPDGGAHGSMSPHVYGCRFPGTLSPNLQAPSPQLDCSNVRFAGEMVSSGTNGDTIIRFAPGDYNVAATMGDRTMTGVASLRVVMGDTPTCTLRVSGESQCSSSVPPPPVVIPPVVTPPTIVPPAVTPPAGTPPALVCSLSTTSTTSLVADIDADATAPSCPYAVAVRIPVGP